MNEFPSSAEKRETPPNRLREATIRMVAGNVLAERLVSGPSFDCFGVSPEFDDEADMAKHYMRQALIHQHDFPLEVALEQYEEAIKQAGGLQAFVDEYDSRREAQRTAAQPSEEMSPQNQTLLP